MLPGTVGQPSIISNDLTVVFVDIALRKGEMPREINDQEDHMR